MLRRAVVRSRSCSLITSGGSPSTATPSRSGCPAEPTMTAARTRDVILVGGMPRSGTYLMRAILAAHPDVAMFPGELPVWRDFAPAYPENLSGAETRARLI